jgi:putative endonuclease
MMKNRQLGRYGEDVAAEYLEKIGMEVVERNWRCREGEIDIVALEGDVLVIVEVKTRTGHGAGHPLEAVTRQKVARLRRLALAWATGHPQRGRGLRIDVVGITVQSDSTELLEHLENVDA